jgi:methionyl-tRNA formyltransferase
MSGVSNLEHREAPRRSTQYGSRISIVLAGQRCPMTAQVLATLLEDEGIDVRALLVASQHDKADSHAQLPVIAQPVERSPADVIAESHGIEILPVSRLMLAQISDLLRQESVDALVAACFPWKLPPGEIAGLPLGSLNIHPSLLPDLRGPEPLFWTFQRGDPVAGITVHLMNERYDEGPILSQERVALVPGDRYQAVEQRLSTTGARLAAEALRRLKAGTTRPSPQKHHSTQWARVPAAEDLVVTQDWEAERAYRFVAGVESRFGPIRVHLNDGRAISVMDALSWQHGASIDRPIHVGIHEVEVAFVGGTVRFLQSAVGDFPSRGEPL